MLNFSLKTLLEKVFLSRASLAKFLDIELNPHATKFVISFELSPPALNHLELKNLFSKKNCQLVIKIVKVRIVDRGFCSPIAYKCELNTKDSYFPDSMSEDQVICLVDRERRIFLYQQKALLNAHKTNYCP
jgi:hypothetical protein